MGTQRRGQEGAQARSSSATGELPPFESGGIIADSPGTVVLSLALFRDQIVTTRKHDVLTEVTRCNTSSSELRKDRALSSANEAFSWEGIVTWCALSRHILSFTILGIAAND